MFLENTVESIILIATRRRSMSNRKSSVVIVAIFLLLACSIFVTQKALADKLGVGSLKGLKSVNLAIVVNDDVTDLLDSTIIKTDIELKIRSITPELSIVDSIANCDGILYIDVGAFTPSDDNMKRLKGLVTYYITGELWQFTHLIRDGTNALAVTWLASTGPAMVGKTKFADAVRGDVKDLIDVFLNDYLKANPKKTVHETGTVTDIDGNIYQTVKIGSQWWMAENLKVTHYLNGDDIPNVTDSAEWAGLTTGAYCEYYNSIAFVATYGRLYNWYAVSDNRNIAPTGWHVPTAAEWQTLVDYLGGDDVAGGKMKETGTTHWCIPNTGATNESGFSALPGGFRDIGNLPYIPDPGIDETYFGMCIFAYFWSSAELDSKSEWSRVLYDNYSRIDFSYGKRKGFSVRCVKD